MSHHRRQSSTVCWRIGSFLTYRTKSKQFAGGVIKTVLSKTDFILVSKVKGSALRLAKSVTYWSIRFFESFEIRYPSLVNRWPGKRMRIKSRPVSSLSRLQNAIRFKKWVFIKPSKNLFFENYNFSVLSILTQPWT